MLISLIIVLLVLGAVVAIVNLAPIDARIKQVIYIVVVVAILIYALQMLAGSGFLRVP